MAVYVPGFECDLFVSYAHVDNDPIFGNPAGWVERLVRNLDGVLASKIGRKDDYTIWWDKRDFRGNHSVADILDRLRRSAVFLVILSPGWLHERSFCRDEMKAFCQRARDERRGCIFTVERDRLDKSMAVPEEIKALGRYTFWSTDNHDTAIPYGIVGSAEAERGYTSQVTRLAADISSQLKHLRGSVRQQTIAPSAPTNVQATTSAEAPEGPQPPLVVLGDVASDLLSERDQARRCLELAGITVWPRSGNLLDEVGFDSVPPCRSGGPTFLQLLGPGSGVRAGTSPPGGGAEIGRAWWQYRRAVEAGWGVRQWRRHNLDCKAVSDSCLRDLLSLETVEADSLDAFLSRVVAAITPNPPTKAVPRAQTAEIPASPPNLFINAAPVDMELARNLRTALASDGLLVSIPERNHGDPRRDLEKSLVKATGTLLLYGDARLNWVKSQVNQYYKLTPQQEARSQRLAVLTTHPPRKDNPIEQSKGVGLFGEASAGPEVISAIKQ